MAVQRLISSKQVIVSPTACTTVEWSRSEALKEHVEKVSIGGRNITNLKVFGLPMT